VLYHRQTTFSKTGSKLTQVIVAEGANLMRACRKYTMERKIKVMNCFHAEQTDTYVRSPLLLNKKCCTVRSLGQVVVAVPTVPHRLVQAAAP